MKKTFNRDQVIGLLRERQGGRLASDLAREIGVTKSYISDLFADRRNPGPKILHYLGLVAEVKTEVIYRKVA
jgi:transcriptional regulator with XRE-family HTH domain